MATILNVTKLSGGILVLVGSALSLTLWLLPLGMPLALVGVALLSSPGK